MCAKRSSLELPVGTRAQPIAIEEWARQYTHPKTVEFRGIEFSEKDFRTIWEVCSYKRDVKPLYVLILHFAADWRNALNLPLDQHYYPWATRRYFLPYPKIFLPLEAGTLAQTNQCDPGSIFLDPNMAMNLAVQSRQLAFGDNEKIRTKAKLWLQTALALPIAPKRSRPLLGRPHSWVYWRVYSELVALKHVRRELRDASLNDVFPEIRRLPPIQLKNLRKALSCEPSLGAADFISMAMKKQWGPEYQPRTIRKAITAYPSWGADSDEARKQGIERARLRIALWRLSR